MLDFTIMQPEGVLVLKPNGVLTKEDFQGLSTAVDSYLSEHTKLQGVLIKSQVFPRWENFSDLATHMHFARNHHKHIARVAVVTDSQLAGIAQSLGTHFTAAEVKQFPFFDEAQALEWLMSK